MPVPQSIHSDRPVTLIGGANLSPASLTAALTLAPGLVAADGGADAVLAAGLRPRAVIGDMDSLSDAARDAFADVLHPVAEQDSTDFDKALRHIAAPLVIAVGFSGGRLDHELAALHALLVHPDRRCILLGPHSLTFLCPPKVSLPLAPGTLVSLFPMAPVRCGSTGLRWPTDGLDFAPGRRIGTSNAALGPVTLCARAPAMLAILPGDCLGLAAAALTGPEVPHWPAPRSPAAVRAR